MITQYLKSLTATFNPLSPSRSHKIPRIILSFLKPNARSATGGGITVKTQILPAGSSQPSGLTLGFKDGKELRWAEKSKAEGTWNLSGVGIKDVVEEVDRHSRALRRKEELTG